MPSPQFLCYLLKVNDKRALMNATTYLRKKEASFWAIRMENQVNGHAARVEHPAES